MPAIAVIDQNELILSQGGRGKFAAVNWRHRFAVEFS